MLMKTHFYLLLVLIVGFEAVSAQQQLPKGFSYVKEVIPHIHTDLRYYGSHNFVGRKVDGYNAPVLILSTKATYALKKIEAELNKQGLALKIFDGYRPQKAVSHFQKWAVQIDDTLGKREFYPHIDKRNLFKLGFIANKSGHSRGSTVDLTIMELENGKELDMGGAFDFFGAVSHFNSPAINSTQKKNRLLLKNVMSKYGFKGYIKEWWHYTLVDEPYQKTYFDFDVK